MKFRMIYPSNENNYLISKQGFLNEGIVKNINSFLPSGILVHAFRKATGGFNCKTACDARSYVSIPILV